MWGGHIFSKKPARKKTFVIACGSAYSITHSIWPRSGPFNKYSNIWEDSTPKSEISEKQMY
jgi:hypothetical protein